MAISEAIRSASAADGGGRLTRPLSCAYAAALNIKAAETTKAFHMAFVHTEADGHLYNKKSRFSGGFFQTVAERSEIRSNLGHSRAYRRGESVF
ncbi:hypothetical protein [Bradyrhizobium algeriense]|uniref:hypothetical protein n=1 Tax=Bradyrhizobium algeriense TaxID=634784 RepID=UPI0011AE573F|nr:hypothetical protein [Bradyrhizobium algeriense]